MELFEERRFVPFLSELRLYSCGRRIKNFNHCYGPHEKDRFLLYFVKEGSAELDFGEKKTVICENTFLVIFPKSQFGYVCRKNLPWSIKWLAVQGDALEGYLSLLGITPENPYMPLKEPWAIEKELDRLYDLTKNSSLTDSLEALGGVYRILSLLASDREKNMPCNSYVLKALELIESSYKNPDFTVLALASAIGLHPNYLSVIFKKEMKISPKRFLTKKRLECACDLLRFSDLSIQSVAKESGFSDEFYFSRAFHKQYAQSPSQYRKD